MAAKQPIISADDLKDVLECPVCLRIPRSAPIFQCERGHVVCSECHPKLVTCPVCRLPLGKTRSLISEKVLSRLPTLCAFSDHGCTVELMKADLEAHEKECLFRLVRCVDLACNEQVAFASLLEHMSNDHEREDFVNAEGSTYASHFIVHEEDFAREIMWISDHLMLDGRHFFRECCRSANGLWFIWVYLLGTPKEAENYVYSIKITSKDKEEELAYKGKVISLDVAKEKLAGLGSGLVFPDATAKHFWTNLKIHYAVAVTSKKSIKKKTTESKSDSNAKQKEAEAGGKNSSSKRSEKSEKATSTTSDSSTSHPSSSVKMAGSASTQSLSSSASAAPGATAKTDSSTATTNNPAEDVRETPC
jgi:hypothetical protein